MNCGRGNSISSFDFRIPKELLRTLPKTSTVAEGVVFRNSQCEFEIELQFPQSPAWLRPVWTSRGLRSRRLLAASPTARHHQNQPMSRSFVSLPTADFRAGGHMPAASRALRRATLAGTVLACLCTTSLTAQQNRFTIQDVLDNASTTAAALSADGRWLVATTATLRDRIGIDNYRFGDPTYIAPSVAAISVFDTRTGTAQKLFPEKRQARAFEWSPDGARLAFLLRDGDVFRPVIWERANGRLRNLTLPAGTHAADNATLQWTEDGTRLLIALRTEEWRSAARRRFEREVKGPIVTMSSKDPFLSWDEIRRLPLRQSLALVDVASGRVQPIMPETMVRSYQL